MCETREYPKQSIIQLMGEDFERKNLPRKKVQVKRVSRAFSGGSIERKGK